MTWTEFSEALGLDRRQEQVVRGLVLGHRREFTRTCLRRTADGAASPLEFLARGLHAKPAPMLEAFWTYLQQHEDGESRRSYAEVVGQQDSAVRDQILGLLTPVQEQRFRALTLNNLVEVTIDPHPDPLDHVLRKLVERLKTAPAARPAPSARDTKYQGLFCSRPFEFAQVNTDGEMFLCCPQQLNRVVGSLLDGDFMPAWNSERAREVRASILDGTFRYCNETTCGKLQARKLPTVEEAKQDPTYRDYIESGKTTMEQGPQIINMSYDLTCNLACPSCRTQHIMLKGEAREPVRIIHDRVVGGHLRDARRLIITGSGDPFQSRLYLSFLRNFVYESNPELRVQLSTNGILLTEEMWHSICNEIIDYVDISVDAATAPTYALNRGGDFEKLLANLRFIGGLRTRQELKHFELHFVVQQNNYREMEDFLRLGREVNCDKVCFKQLVNWGTYSDEEYVRRAVQLPGHPEHEAFLAVLRQPVFTGDRRGVSLHDLSELASRS